LKALVFAHYSPLGILSKSAALAIRSYSPYFDRIAFVSTSPLTDSDKDILSEHCATIIVRENEGYDFISWKVGVEALGPLDNFTSVIIANDSVIGPLDDAGSLFQRLFDSRFDVCGLTLSWEHRRHAQSYFLHFASATLRSGAFETFWTSIAPFSSKQAIIETYEIGLTQFMEDHDHSVGALFEPPAKPSWRTRIRLAARSASLSDPIGSLKGIRLALIVPHLNPTHYLWREILDQGLPFLKKELLRTNPAYQNLRLVRKEIRQRFLVDATELRQHLDR